MSTINRPAYLDVPPNPRKLDRARGSYTPPCEPMGRRRTYLFEPDGSPSFGILSTHRHRPSQYRAHDTTHRHTHKELHQELDCIQIKRCASTPTRQDDTRIRRKKSNVRAQSPLSSARSATRSQSDSTRTTEPVERGDALFRDGRGRTEFDDGDLARSIGVHAIEPSPQPGRSSHVGIASVTTHHEDDQRGARRTVGPHPRAGRAADQRSSDRSSPLGSCSPSRAVRTPMGVGGRTTHALNAGNEWRCKDLRRT